MGQSENTVMYAVEQVCGLYGVQSLREQSRVMRVESRGGWRLMYFGKWTDNEGKIHNGGRADFLLRPRIVLGKREGVCPIWQTVRVPVPLWVECKAGTGYTKKSVRVEQEAFRAWVTGNGDYYLKLVEDVRPLIAWFEDHGVEKNASDEALAAVVTPMDASELDKLPCRWCGAGKEHHMGKILSCPLHLRANDSRLIGKVWSPKLASRREK